MSFSKRSLIAVTLAWVTVAPFNSRAQSERIEPEAQLPQLNQIIADALLDSPRIVVRNTEAAAFAADVQIAKSARLPSMGAFVNWTRGEENRQYYSNGAQSAEKLGYTVSLSQSLYQWNAVTLGIESAKIRQQIDAGNTRLAYLSLVKGIRYNYMSAIMARGGLTRARLNEDLAQTNLSDLTDKRAKNLASDAEVFNAGLARDAAIIERMAAEETLRRTLIVLGRFVGKPPLNEQSLPDDLPLPNTDRIGSIAQSLVQGAAAGGSVTNTAVENAKRQLAVQGNDLAVGKTALRPRFSAVVGMTRDEQSLTADPTSRYESDYVYGGLQVSWAIFDGFATRSRIKSSLARIRVAEINLTAQERELAEDIEHLSTELTRAGMAVKLEEKKLESAENYLKFIQRQVTKGEASESQASAARLNALQARLLAFNVRFGYWNTLSDLLALTETDPVLDRLPTQN